MRPLHSTFGEHRLDRWLDGLRLTVTRHRAGLRSPRHAHDYACLHYVLDGVYVEQTSDRVVACGRGEILSKGPGVEHANAFGSAAATSLRIECHGRDDELLGSVDLHSLLAGATPLGPELEELTRAVLAEAPDGVLEELLVRFRLALEQPCRADGPAPVEIRAAERIVADPLSCSPIAGLAAELGVHRSHLARQFQRRFGCSLSRFVLRQRTLWAARQLLGEQRSLGEIAHDAGFADQSHCTRTFRDLFGVPPGRWRSVAR